MGLAAEKTTFSPGTARAIWEEHMQQNLLNSGETGNPDTWKYFYLLLGRTAGLLLLPSLSPCKIKKYLWLPPAWLLYSCSQYTRCFKGICLALFVSSRASTQNNFDYISKMYQNKLRNITIHAVLLMSLLEHILFFMYSNYILISLIFPQDPLRLLPAELKFTMAYCFYWQEPEYKGSLFFFSFQSWFQEGHIFLLKQLSSLYSSGIKSREMLFLCIIMKSPWTIYSFT